jgi:hypothetical protein
MTETTIDDVFSKEEQALIFQTLDGPLQSESDDVRCLAESITRKLKLPGDPPIPHR